MNINENAEDITATNIEDNAAPTPPNFGIRIKFNPTIITTIAIEL